MRYIRGFRDGGAAAAWAELIRQEANPAREYHLMEFCGGHTHAIFRYGVEDLLPESVRLIHGPGCPVCVLAMPRLDAAIALARGDDITFVSYGDMMRVPASRRQSLLKARAQGADVRMVYSALEALDIAIARPERQVVFFAIGFETTTPATAQEFDCVLQPCGYPRGHRKYSGGAGGARMGAGSHRRFHWAIACECRDWQPTV
jgi:hydrogenase expression/formation protein HypD